MGEGRQRSGREGVLPKATVRGFTPNSKIFNNVPRPALFARTRRKYEKMRFPPPTPDVPAPKRDALRAQLAQRRCEMILKRVEERGDAPIDTFRLTICLRRICESVNLEPYQEERLIKRVLRMIPEEEATPTTRASDASPRSLTSTSDNTLWDPACQWNNDQELSSDESESSDDEDIDPRDLLGSRPCYRGTQVENDVKPNPLYPGWAQRTIWSLSLTDGVDKSHWQAIHNASLNVTRMSISRERTVVKPRRVITSDIIVAQKKDRKKRLGFAPKSTIRFFFTKKQKSDYTTELKTKTFDGASGHTAQPNAAWTEKTFARVAASMENPRSTRIWTPVWEEA